MKLKVKDKSFDHEGKRYFPGEEFEVDNVDELAQAINWGKLKVIEDQPVVKSIKKKKKEKKKIKKEVELKW